MKKIFKAFLFTLSSVMTACLVPTKTHAPSDTSPLWTYSSGGIANGNIAETEELVLASKTDGKEVKAIDANDGKERWSFTDSAMKPFLYAPSYANGVAYVTSYDHHGVGADFLVYALDAKTGREMWRSDKFGIEVPQVRPGMLIGTTLDNRYLAVDAKTGTEVFSISVADEDWKKSHKGQEIREKQLTEDGKLLLLTSTPSLVQVDFQRKNIQEVPLKLKGETADTRIYLDGSTLYRIGWDFIKNQYNDFGPKYRHIYLQALDLNTGKELWAKDETMKFNEIKAVENGTLCVKDWSGNLMAYDTRTGKERWPQPLSVGYNSVLFDKYTQGKIIVKEADADGKLSAYDAATGKELWSVGKHEAPNDYFMIAYDGVIYSWTNDSKQVFNSSVTVETQLTAYDLNTGAYIWRRLADKIGISTSFFKDKFIVTADGSILALPAKKS